MEDNTVTDYRDEDPLAFFRGAIHGILFGILFLLSILAVHLIIGKSIGKPTIAPPQPLPSILEDTNAK
jgi:hypothetical protein